MCCSTDDNVDVNDQKLNCFCRVACRCYSRFLRIFCFCCKSSKEEQRAIRTESQGRKVATKTLSETTQIPHTIPPKRIDSRKSSLERISVPKNIMFSAFSKSPMQAVASASKSYEVATTTNGVMTDGSIHSHHVRTPSGHLGSRRKTFRSSTHSHEGSSIGDAALILQRRVTKELGAGVAEQIMSTDFDSIVEWIHHERLMSLPKEGSHWDTILVWAHTLAELINQLDIAIEHFNHTSNTAANIAYGLCLKLLELGSENSEALEAAFGLFNHAFFALAALLERSELFNVSSEIREQLSLAFVDLLSIIENVTILYHKSTESTTSHTSVDLYSAYGVTINSFHKRCARISTEMWRYQLKRSDIQIEEGLEPKELHTWLSPSDHVLRSTARSNMNLAHEREEYSCLWAEPHITAFVKSQDRVLAVTGGSGSGKTVLASTIYDRLQRPIARKVYTTVFASINQRVPTQATSLNLVKELLLQLLERRIGNLHLYSNLVEAYHACKHASNVEAYEEALWIAFSKSVGTHVPGGRDLVVLVDGLDEVMGESANSHKLFTRLRDTCGRSETVKLITLSQASAIPADQGPRLEISASRTFEDVFAVAKRTFMAFEPYQNLSYADQETAASRITKASNGSFLWTKLLIKLLERQKVDESHLNTLENSDRLQKTVTELILLHLQLQNLSDTCKNILSFLSIAYRPLSIAELRTLLEVHSQKGTSPNVDIHHELHPVASLVFISDDVVYIRHALIRHSLNEIFSHRTFPLPIKDRYMDFFHRILLYTQSSLDKSREPTFTDVEPSFIDSTFQKFPLLEYIVEFWPSHFKSTPMYKPNGEVAVTQDFKGYFPVSPSLCLIENNCWTAQLPSPVKFEWLKLVASIRRETLGINHPATLQSVINCAVTFESFERYVDASTFFYSAMTISQNIYGSTHRFTTQCATHYLRVTEFITITTKDETFKRKETVLLLLIETYKSESLLKELLLRRQALIALYVQVNDQERAAEVTRVIEVEEGSKDKQWHAKEETHAGHLKVDLHHRRTGPTYRTLDRSLFAHDEAEEVTREFDVHHVDSMSREAESYAKQSNFAMAERTWVALWSQVAQKCREHQSVDWHERQIRVVQGYSNFLRSQKRDQEASSTLIGLWQEYKDSQVIQSRTIVDRLTEVAKQMKTVGASAFALSIFKFAQSHYKSTRAEHTSEYASLQQEVESSSRELTQSVTSTTITESVLRELFVGSSFTGSSSERSIHKVDASAVSSAKVLIQRYVDELKWYDAIETIHMVLKSIWPDFLDGQVDTLVLSKDHEDYVWFVETLATCYSSLRRYQKTEDTLVRTLRAVRSGRRTDNKLVTTAIDRLVSFYKSRDELDKLIALYQDLLVEYNTAYGDSSKIAIDTRYTLGDLCRQRPNTHKYWIEYYFQIITALNKNAEVCHPDALDAMLIVTHYFWEDHRYLDSLPTLRVIWTTFKTKPKDYKQFTDTKVVQTFFDRYVRCLEESKTEITTIYHTVKEYRDLCIKVFGATAVITVTSTMTLAQICERSDKYEAEAVELYEELLKTSSSTVNTTEIKGKLNYIYAAQARRSIHESTTSREVSTRAVHYVTQRFTEVKSKYGVAHSETLSHLRELSILHFKSNKTEEATREIVNTSNEIMTKETSSTRMLEAAASLSEMFREGKQTQRGIDLTKEYHRQIIAKDSSNVSKVGFDVTKSDRQKLVFLAALHHHFRQNLSLGFAEIYADLTAEQLYYEQFRATIKSKTSTEDLFRHGKDLYIFLREKQYLQEAERVIDETVAALKQHESASTKHIKDHALRVFVVMVFEYLAKHHTHNLTRSIALGGNQRVDELIRAGKLRDACDIAQCTFQYVQAKGGYTSHMQTGFKLARLLSNPQLARSTDKNLRKDMLHVAQNILEEMLHICHRSNISMFQVQHADLNSIIEMMGEQENYKALESLLRSLWTAREVQRNWRPSLTLAIGHCLIRAEYLIGHVDESIRLAEAITYNLRRVHGTRSGRTLDMNALLASLYISAGLRLGSGSKDSVKTASGYFAKAAAVHEDTLRILVDHEIDADDDLNGHEHLSMASSGHLDGDLSLTEEPRNYGHLTKKHLHLLKLAVQRLGKWPKDYAEYQRLNAKAFLQFPKELEGFEGVEKWNIKNYGSGKAESDSDVFVTPTRWSIWEREEREEEL